MLYIPDNLLDHFLLEDINMGDLTTRSLGLDKQQGVMTFVNRQPTVTSGIKVSERLLDKLGLHITESLENGMMIPERQLLLKVEGDVGALHQGWKVTQNVLEWTCGVAQFAADMVKKARSVNPDVQIACTRKSIPGTRFLATAAILDGGAIIHRAGTSETILLFANHRHCLPEPFDWIKHIEQLRRCSPGKKIIVEANTMDEAEIAMSAHADAIQLDKFTPAEIKKGLELAEKMTYTGKLIAAGGINLSNIKEYAATGVSVLVTSAPYYAKPADMQVKLGVV